MRYLFCCNTFRGFCNFRLDVVRHLIENGAEAVIVSPLQVRDVEVIAKLPEGCSAVNCPMAPHGKSIVQDIVLFFRLCAIIKKYKPDMVFNYTIKPNIYGGFASWMRGVPSVAIVPGLGYSFSKTGVFGQLLRGLYLRALNLANAVFVLNSSDQSKLLDEGLTAQRIVLLQGGEGVNLDRFPFTEGDYKVPRFLMIARLLYEKGYREFVEAAERVKSLYPDARFEIAGSFYESNPSSVPREVVAADETAGRIHYLSYVEDINKELSDSNTVVVIPSYYREGMNRSLMEACSCGRPVIATNLPGLKEMVLDNENGFLVEPKNVDSLYEKIVAFMELPVKDRQEMGRKSRRLAELRFNVESVNIDYDTTITKILNHV